ncbi:MAG TPA: hypothetical protein VHA14_14480 [Bryobacteraceae bacterium]|nr:hypothetical protein [Bryobacteraceae bacterium]
MGDITRRKPKRAANPLSRFPERENSDAEQMPFMRLLDGTAIARLTVVAALCGIPAEDLKGGFKWPEV